MSGTLAMTDTIDALASTLRREARLTNQRRMLLIHGRPASTADATEAALQSAGFGPEDTTSVGEERPPWATEHLDVRDARSLLGTTRSALVLSAHETCRPNVLGQVAGVVDGGGLLIYRVPSPESWSPAECSFHRSLAVPPFDVDAVGHRFHDRIVELARVHPGIAIVDADAETIERTGLTEPAPHLDPQPPTPPENARFPTAVYDRCLTQDQVSAVRAFEDLESPGTVVVEADRGRGKSSAAGLAVAALALEGASIVVTAPTRRAVDPLFERAREILREADNVTPGGPDGELTTGSGGRIRFLSPTAAAALAAGDRPDLLVVDEAASIPVHRHEGFLGVDRLACISTVHGYEGTGRGFEVRVRGLLADREAPITDVRLSEPIRYAAGDPVEVWAFRLLGLDATPAVDQVVAEATPESVGYRAMDSETMLEDERLFREALGLLVSAHYRTEPNDVVRLLDAPNVRTRTLVHESELGEHVVAVALLAREGGLDGDTRSRMYEGERVAGNMIPDVLTAQLRDETAGTTVGTRLLRLATHDRVRRRGLGSRLLEEVAAAVGPERDWLGAGFGATPDLVGFWETNGYETVHLSLRRNERSGERSVIMLAPTSDRGVAVVEDHAEYFADRVAGVLGDALDDADVDLVRAALGAHRGGVDPDLGERDWRQIVGAAYGPGLIDVDPAPFRELALAHLLGPDGASLDAAAERLLVAKVLQGRAWATVADEFGYVSRAECMRAIGAAYRPLVDRYGTGVAHRDRARFVDRNEPGRS